MKLRSKTLADVNKLADGVNLLSEFQTLAYKLSVSHGIDKICYSVAYFNLKDKLEKMLGYPVV